MTKEELARKIFLECEKDGEPITVEESLEMAEMEIKAGNVKLSTGHKKSDRKAPTRKEDTDKRYLIETMHNCLNVYTTQGIENLTIANVERQIDFEYNGNCYSITLTKHRPPK